MPSIIIVLVAIVVLALVLLSSTIKIVQDMNAASFSASVAS